PRWKLISDELALDMPEPVETYSTSDHLYSDLTIPASATGRLPRSKRTRAGLDAEYVDTEGDHQGSRKRGDRSRGRGRSGPAGDGAPETPRPRRVRTRSRSGVTVGGSDSAAEPATEAGTAPEAATTQPSGTGPDNGAGPRNENDRPRRRRRRGGARRRENADGGETSAADTAAAS
ncbi:MAG TPA: ATP-dependent helicase, partial [Pseudonocardia sp.]